MLRKLLFGGCFLLLATLSVQAQTSVLPCSRTATGCPDVSNANPLPVTVTGGSGTAPTNRSAIITTGLTYQVVVPAGTYKSILIENNNTNTDLCYVEDSGLVVATNTTSTSVTTTNGATTASKASITLAVNGSYNQNSLTTSAAIVATCASTNDWLYVRTQ